MQTLHCREGRQWERQRGREVDRERGREVASKQVNSPSSVVDDTTTSSCFALLLSLLEK